MLLFKRVDDIKVFDICIGYIGVAVLATVVGKTSYEIGRRRGERGKTKPEDKQKNGE